MQSIVMWIVDTIASVLGGVLLLRFWTQAVRVQPPSSVAHFIFQLSDWLVKPLRKVLSGVGGYDWASLLGALLIALVATLPLLALGYGFSVVFLIAVQRFLHWIIYGFMALLVLEAIFSWINPQAPLAPFVRALNEPVLRPIRRVIPLLGGIDLSLLVALVVLQVAQLLVAQLGFIGR